MAKILKLRLNKLEFMIISIKIINQYFKNLKTLSEK